MLKQSVSILLIFTVNILFLTHTVLPHHHHDKGVPHFTMESQHSPVHNDCCCPEEKGDEEACQLFQPIEVVYETDENCHCLLCCASHDHAAVLLQAVLLTFTYDFTAPERDELLRQSPYLNFYQSIFICRIFGLRAPPAGMLTC
jgi:hypothetical protein